MEDESEESKLETLSNIIKRKDSRIKMLSKISRNSTLIRLNLLVSAQLDKSTSNFQMKSEEFVSDLIDLLINSVIKVEPPAPTPQATHDETPSVEEICENFGLNDVDLDYSDADYQNLTTYKMFQQAYRSRIQSANPKVRYFCLPYPCFCFESMRICPMLLQKLQKFVEQENHQVEH